MTNLLKYIPIIAVAIVFTAVSPFGAVLAQTFAYPEDGGLGTNEIPTYGVIPVGNSSGTYTLTATSSLGISGGSGTFSWTPQSWGNSTSTILGFPGFISTASSTFTTLPNIPLTKGNFLVGNDSGTAQATSTIFISSLGHVGVGTAVPSNTLTVSDTGSGLGIRNSTANTGAVMSMYHDDPTITTGETLGTLNFYGLDSAERLGAQIKVRTYGTWGTETGDAPSYISFYTQTDNNTNQLGTPVMSLFRNSGGNPAVGIGMGDAAESSFLHPLSVLGISGASSGATTNGILRITTSSATNGESLQIGTVDNNYSWIQPVVAGASPTYRNLVLNPSGGNVGIGTTSPGQKLSVAGDILGNNIIGSYFTATSTTASSFLGGLTAFASSTIGNGTQAGGLTISGGATTTGWALFQNTTNSANGFQVLDANGGVPIFNVNTTNEYVSVGYDTSGSDTGYLTIGTSTPYVDDTGGPARLTIGNLPGNSVIHTSGLGDWTAGLGFVPHRGEDWSIGVVDNTSDFRIAKDDTGLASNVYFFIDQDGLVGIGTTSPYARLSVEGSSALGNSALAGYFIATSTTATSTFTGISATSANIGNFYNMRHVSNENLVFGTNFNSQSLYGSAVFTNASSSVLGTNVGATHATTSGWNNSGYFTFDGADDYISFPHNQNQLATNGFTLTAWIKPNSIGETNGRIMDKSTGTSGQGGFMFSLNASDLIFRRSGGFAQTVADDLPYDGRWRFVTATVDSSGMASVYIDGVLLGGPTATGALTDFTTTNNLCVGNRSTSGGCVTDRTFDGAIDDPQMYGRVLTVPEIKALYEQRSEVQDSFLRNNGFLTLLGSGNFGIGTTSPQYKLSVQSTSDTNMFQLYDTDGNCLQNPESGAITTTCTSDIKYKTNIRPSRSMLSYFDDFLIREYEVRSSGDTRLGVVAQELELTHPELVKDIVSTSTYQIRTGTTTSITEDGVLTEPVYETRESTSTEKFVELPSVWQLLKAIQEIWGRITSIFRFSGSRATGINLYDTANGNPYCVQITNGALTRVAGVCK